MTRNINSSLLNQLYVDGDPTGNLKDIEPYYAIDLEFDSGNLRLWTGTGNRTIQSNTFLGTGSLLQINGIEEVSDLSAKGTTLTLSGLSSSIITNALTEDYQGRAATVYWGVLGTSSVVNVFSGFMDKMSIVDEGETSTVSLTVESKLIVLERASARRYTHASQQATVATEGYDESTDTIFKWVTRLADKQIPWGRQLDS
jgi:hypothetical protein